MINVFLFSTRQIWSVLLLVLASLSAFATPARADPNATRAKALADGFENAQLAGLSESSIALNAIVARTARSGSPIAELEKQREMLEAQREQAIVQFEATLGLNDEANVQSRERASRQRQDLSRQLALVEAAVKQQDPAYWDLIRPDALPLRAAQALLNPDEVMLFIFTSDTATYSFALTNETAIWSRSADLRKDELSGIVGAMRRGIELERKGIAAPGDGFSPQLSHSVYAQIIAPLESAMRGRRRLIAVVNGPLAALPLQTLATNAASNLNAVKWLGDSYILTNLPTVATLQTLRCLTKPEGQRHRGCNPAVTSSKPLFAAGQSVPLLGFGDPTLGPPDVDNDRGGEAFSGMMVRGVADRSKLMQLPSLPGTRKEIESISSQFGPSQSRVFLADNATETNVRQQMGKNGFRFVVFSTHGLLASQSGAVDEPGLVLTPPEQGKASPLDDGYLTASEITQFQLAGSTIILSACNTATVENGVSARNLQSLARAFQFAGAQRIVATQWAVVDESTAALMAEFFGLLRANPTMAEDVALQQASAKVRGKSAWRSPSFWAPFVIIGLP